MPGIYHWHARILVDVGVDVQVSVNKEVSFTDKTLFSERFKSIAEEPEIIVTHASRSKRNKVHFLIVIV